MGSLGGKRRLAEGDGDASMSGLGFELCMCSSCI